MKVDNIDACEEDLENKLGFACRICLEFGGEPNDDLISPCQCKGTQRFVHRLCLNRWRSQKEGLAFSHCPTCKSQFRSRALCDFTFKLFVERELESIRQVLDYGTSDAKLQRRMLTHIYQSYRNKLDGIQGEKILKSLESLDRQFCINTTFYRWYSAVDKAYMFRGVSNDLILQLVSKMKVEKHTQRFVKEGAPSSNFYVVLRGSVSLTKDENTGHDHFYNFAKEGDMIGEITTIYGMPQYFSAQPEKYSHSCIVLRLDRGTFFELVQDRLSDAAVIMNNISQQLEKDYTFYFLREIIKSKEGRKPDLITLHLAALEGNHSLMLQLLKRGSDPNKSDEKGRTALHLAASKGSEQCVRLLLCYGANPNVRDREGSIPLWEAMLGSHETVVKLLKQRGADISLGDVGTFANIAAHHKNLNLLKQIVQFGGDINLPSLIETKITDAWVNHKTSIVKGDFFGLLFKVVTFDYVRRADKEESFFGRAFISLAHFPNSLLVHKKRPSRKHAPVSDSTQNSDSDSSSRRIEGCDETKNRDGRSGGSSSCGDAAVNKDQPGSIPHDKGGCCASNCAPRVVISCPHKDGNSYMVLIPDSFKELLEIASEKFRVLSGDIMIKLADGGAFVDCLEVIRDGDSLVIVPDVRTKPTSF